MVLGGSMAYPLGCLQALQCFSFCLPLDTFPPVAGADILGSLECGQGAQSDSFHNRRKISLEKRAAKPCAQRMQEGGVRRWAAPPQGTWGRCFLGHWGSTWVWVLSEVG